MMDWNTINSNYLSREINKTYTFLPSLLTIQALKGAMHKVTKHWNIGQRHTLFDSMHTGTQ